MDIQAYNYSFTTHRDRKVILIQFPYSDTLKKSLKNRFSSVRYSSTHRAWYLPDLPVVRKQLMLPSSKPLTGKQHKIHPVNHQAYNNMEQQLDLKAYSPNTKRLYLAEFAHLLELLRSMPVSDLTIVRLKDYFLYCVQDLQMKERKMNGKINAIKFYYEKVAHRPRMFFDIPRPKKPLTLPNMLSKKEVKRLLATVTNHKHSIALQLCYGMGLRVSEVVNLKINDINSDRMQVGIRGAKGKKDRYVPLPQSLLPQLREYYKAYRPTEYLLEGQYGGQYSKSSVQQVFKKAMRQAGIYKNIGIHGLRHSYATHLLENGADVRFIQELLGHNSIKTTQIYTKVAQTSLSKIVSPLDQL